MGTAARHIVTGVGRLVLGPWQGVDRFRGSLARINDLEPALARLGDEQLRKTSLSLRYRARGGEPLSDLLPEAFALVREASRRTLGLRHYDVQLLGGIAMHHRSVVEMQTGEGKTLAATLPMYLSALPGRGAHLATVNDYLARRDAELLRPLYRLLGMTVGVVEADTSPDDRRAAYESDVTYGTAREFGFDFLRERLRARRTAAGDNDLLGRMMGLSTGEADRQTMQRGAWFALVDEADSVLIDEARTPLVISAPPGSDEEVARDAYRWGALVAPQFIEPEHYHYDDEKKTVELTAAGRRLARSLPHPDALDAVGMLQIYDYLEQAIQVRRDFQRDRHYIIRDGEVVIVDEFTGRLSEGRKWRSGMHQAIEAREGVAITFPTNQAARITVQDFFLRYEHLSGMSGTVSSSAAELRKIYRAAMVVVPTNRPVVRRMLPTLVYADDAAKWAAIAAEIADMHAAGRPVLIGTRSIDKSQHLADLLSEAGIEHQVLNAHRVADEAEIVARAGERGRVTVSTNMAGRGTDIVLGRGVCELGGLHVIATELHESARIDRQLLGRCGRQGDPGTWRRFLALSDEILRVGLGPKRAERLSHLTENGAGPLPGLEHHFQRAQRVVERRHFRQRRALMYHERLRKELQEQMGQDPYLDAPG